MPAPFYADIGKIPRDILNSGYHFGLVKLDCTAKTDHHITFNFGGVYTIESKVLGGYAGAKGNTDSFGLGIKWNGDVMTDEGYMKANTITGEASAKDQYLKLTADCTADVEGGFTGGHIKNAFRDDHAALNLETEVKKDGPFVVEAALALEYEGLVGGVQLAYDAQGSQFVKNNLAFEYTHADATIAAKIEDEKIFGVLGGYKVNEKLDVALEVNWNNEESAASGTLGVKYELSDIGSTLRAKVNNEAGLGLSLAKRFKDCITVTGSAFLDCKNMANEPKNKVGLAVEVEI